MLDRVLAVNLDHFLYICKLNVDRTLLFGATNRELHCKIKNMSPFTTISSERYLQNESMYMIKEHNKKRMQEYIKYTMKE